MKLETKIKKWSLKDWKDEAWRLCSIYNRRKDNDWKGDGRCCTCSKTLNWQEGDAGHFQAGRGNAILFYDKGIHLQCKQCNGPGKGEQYIYGQFLAKRYGQDEVDKQIQIKHEVKKYEREDYIGFIKEYEDKIAKLNV